MSCVKEKYTNTIFISIASLRDAKINNIIHLIGVDSKNLKQQARENSPIC